MTQDDGADSEDTDWPRIDDGDPTVAIRSVARRLFETEKRLRRLRGLAILLAVALAVAGIAYSVHEEQAEAARNARFCVLAEQAILNATPGKPVSPLLIAAHQALDCRRLPAVGRTTGVAAGEL